MQLRSTTTPKSTRLPEITRPEQYPGQFEPWKPARVVCAPLRVIGNQYMLLNKVVKRPQADRLMQKFYDQSLNMNLAVLALRKRHKVGK